MSKEERTLIKDTRLGKWLKTAAPGVLDKVADLLPDQEGVGYRKDLLDQEPNVDPQRQKQE